MTTVTEARRELAQIAERQAELQKIVDAAPKSLLEKHPSGSSAYYLTDGITGFHAVTGMKPFNDASDGNIFQSVDVADAYADALDTLLMLRHQPGSEAAIEGGVQCFIRDADGNIAVDTWTSINYKTSCISPMFATFCDAQAAIDTIGADRILRMFRTLHGVA